MATEWNMSRNMETKFNPQQLAVNIWQYILQSKDDDARPRYNPVHVIALLKSVREIFAAEQTMLCLQTPLHVLGDILGQGDSLITLLSLSGLPPSKQLLFLGNYTGLGFCSVESLLLALAFKAAFPQKVFLLRGSHEDPEILQKLRFVTQLTERGLMNDALVWIDLVETLKMMPLAALVDDCILCVHGGPGPTMRKYPVDKLYDIPRPPIHPEESLITTECQWTALVDKERFDIGKSGFPLCTFQDASGYCEANKLRLIVRSRQIVTEGFLNQPREVVTITSANSWLEAFRNEAVCLVLESDRKAHFIRYRKTDRDPESLDEDKPINTRNALF